MKSIIFFAFFALALLQAVPARAFETPVTDPQGKALLQKTAGEMQKYAEQFNCKKFVFGNISGNGSVLTLQFMPGTQLDLTQWQRLLSITIYGLSGDKDTDNEFVRKIITGLEHQYKGTAVVTADENYLRNHEATMFLEYTQGATTPEPVQVTSVFMRVSDKTYAFIQLSGRTTALKPDESMSMRKLVNPGAK